MIVYHSGFVKIEEPDIHHGRKNADFGQGFYLSDNEEFCKRWAKFRKGEETMINRYELDLNGLKVRYLKRDEEWFSYLYDNRHNKEDICNDDVIIGPIANDTIYDTFGVITSGILKPEKAMELLRKKQPGKAVSLQRAAPKFRSRHMKYLPPNRSSTFLNPSP